MATPSVIVRCGSQAGAAGPWFNPQTQACAPLSELASQASFWLFVGGLILVALMLVIVAIANAHTRTGGDFERLPLSGDAPVARGTVYIHGRFAAPSSAAAGPPVADAV